MYVKNRLLQNKRCQTGFLWNSRDYSSQCGGYAHDAAKASNADVALPRGLRRESGQRSHDTRGESTIKTDEASSNAPLRHSCSAANGHEWPRSPVRFRIRLSRARIVEAQHITEREVTKRLWDLSSALPADCGF